jgi:uncharacterized protein with PhoU and TrkA domain
MDPAETRLTQLSLQIGMAGMQAAKAYQEAQNALNLEQVLTPQRFAHSDGVRQSLATLDDLSRLNAAHKEMFTRFITSAVEQMTTALAELPAERAREHRDGLVRSINWNLDAQSTFYRQRDEWISAASALCHLVDENRESITVEDDALMFNDDDLLERFTQLASRVDELHRLEVAQQSERMARLGASLTTLGFVQK